MIEQTLENQESEQRLFIFEEPLLAEDMKVKVYGLDDLAQIQARNKDQYGNLSVDIPQWNAGTLHVLGRDARNIDPTNLEAHVSSALHSQAIRNRLCAEDAMPLTVSGVVEVEGRILAGVRRGYVQRDRLSVIPLGYNDPQNQPKDQFILEAFDEVGLPLELILYETILILGYQTDPTFTNGLNVVVYARSALKTYDILAKHGTALAIAQNAQRQALEEGESAFVARKRGKKAITTFNELRGKDLPVDAADHDPIIFLTDLQIAAVPYHDPFDALANISYPLMGITQGALQMYSFCLEQGMLERH